jgi:hypothetical protein
MIFNFPSAIAYKMKQHAFSFFEFEYAGERKDTENQKKNINGEEMTDRKNEKRKMDGWT